jgi:hypothetical protein
MNARVGLLLTAWVLLTKTLAASSHLPTVRLAKMATCQPGISISQSRHEPRLTFKVQTARKGKPTPRSYTSDANKPKNDGSTE